MDYAAFKLKYAGSKQDYDNKHGYQCVDLAKLWAKEGWILKPSSVGHNGYAKEVFKHSDSMLSSKVVLRIPYKNNIVPPQGAIIIFDSAAKNKVGHIAVVDHADSKNVTVLEQNGGTGNGDGKGSNAIRLKSYVYGANGSGVGAVLGWLIPIQKPANGSEKYTAPSKRYFV